MPRQRARPSSPPRLTVVSKPSPPSGSSSKRSSTPSSTRATDSDPQAAETPPSSTPPPSSSSSPAALDAKLRRARANAAEQRRRSGLTIEARVTQLCERILDMVRHYPQDGIHLVEMYEELADSAELRLQCPG